MEADKEAETKDGRVNTLSQKVFPIQEGNVWESCVV